MAKTSSRDEQLSLLEQVQTLADAIKDVFLTHREPTHAQRMTLAHALDSLNDRLFVERNRLMGRSPSNRAH